MKPMFLIDSTETTSGQHWVTVAERLDAPAEVYQSYLLSGKQYSALFYCRAIGLPWRLGFNRDGGKVPTHDDIRLEISMGSTPPAAQPKVSKPRWNGEVHRKPIPYSERHRLPPAHVSPHD